MTPKTKKLEEFHVIGISVRTTNQGGKSQKDIGELFGIFFRDNLIEKIPNKESNDVYCIYTEYESDFKAPYTAVIGCKVTSLETVPAGLIKITVPTLKYLVFKSIGKLPESVGMTWNQIWQSRISRKYIADFDVYGQKAQNPNDAEVDTYVSIK
jgi:predicted transcriptional regulator YdeE